jgi:hypothetical protein
MQKHIFLILCSIIYCLTPPVSASPSYNSLGQTGLINTPSAEIHNEQSLYFTFNRGSYTKLGTLTATPFNWLEASYFYYRPDDLLWGSTKGLYLDKGFNIKVSYKPKNILLPQIALGLDDFAGTGQFTREYIVTTYNFNTLKLTTGVGWGKYVGSTSYKNPLSLFSDRFSDRPLYQATDQGGQPSYNQWFRGPAAPLIGIEKKFISNKNLSIKIEYDPFDYFKFGCCGEGISQESTSERVKDLSVNFGLSYRLNEYGNIDMSYIKGNSWNLSFSIGLTNKNYRKKNKFRPVIKNKEHNQPSDKNEFYLDLLDSLNNKKLFLQTADLEESTLNMTIESADHFNPIIYSSRAAYIANEVSKQNNIYLKSIEIGHLSRGIKINSIKYNTSDLDLTNRKPDILIKRNTLVAKPNLGSFNKHEFKPSVLFPVIFNQFSPDIKTHVGSPEKFLYSGIGVKATTEIQINRHLVFYSVIGKSIQNNFDKKVSDPNSQLATVRTQIVDYLQNTSNDLYITNLSLENIWSPYNNIYAKINIGYLEGMYGGIASEVLYKPFESNLAFSVEYNKVKQRSFSQKFSFNKYKVSTKHLNIAYYHPQSNILTKWSYGKYLAADRGYTLDLSRRMPNGWQAGIWFSNTNVSAEQFGEGSFDKGFYVNIPLSIFSKNYSKNVQGFSLRTMTRDGAQRLELRNRLIDSFYGSSLDELNENWSTYLD